MAGLVLRSQLNFFFDDETKWFADKARVADAVDVILAAPLAKRITHAGTFGKERAVKGADGIRKAIANGKATSFGMLDAKAQDEASTYITLDVGADELRFSMLLQGDALAEVARTVFVDIEAIAMGLSARVRDLGGLALGFAHPMGGKLVKGRRSEPRVRHRRHETWSMLDVIDLRFHRGEHERALPDEAEPLASAPTPPEVHRTEQDGVLALRWIDGVEDLGALLDACERHERWMAGALGIESGKGSKK
ncbi:MAG: hypothetical protein R3B70_35205 [Polyangiaceae bacterium]